MQRGRKAQKPNIATVRKAPNLLSDEHCVWLGRVKPKRPRIRFSLPRQWKENPFGKLPSPDIFWRACTAEQTMRCSILALLESSEVARATNVWRIFMNGERLKPY